MIRYMEADLSITKERHKLRYLRKLTSMKADRNSCGLPVQTCTKRASQAIQERPLFNFYIII